MFSEMWEPKDTGAKWSPWLPHQGRQKPEDEMFLSFEKQWDWGSCEQQDSPVKGKDKKSDVNLLALDKDNRESSICNHCALPGWVPQT